VGFGVLVWGHGDVFMVRGVGGVGFVGRHWRWKGGVDVFGCGCWLLCYVEEGGGFGMGKEICFVQRMVEDILLAMLCVKTCKKVLVF